MQRVLKLQQERHMQAMQAAMQMHISKEAL
jgi:hypothetical protein